MLLLSLFISPLKATTSVMTIICSSPSSIYHYQVLQNWPQVDTNTQHIGTELATKATKYPDWCFNKLIDGCEILCHAIPNKDCLTNGKLHWPKKWGYPWSSGFIPQWLIHATNSQGWPFKPDIITQTSEKRLTKSLQLLPMCEDPLQRNGIITRMQPHHTLWFEVAVDLIQL